MRHVFIFSLALLAVISFQSCEDDCTAGESGSLTIVATLIHHNPPAIANLPNYPDTVFVKFCAEDLPGTDAGDFDKIYIGETGEDHVHLDGLKAGKYYLYAAGFDTTINQRVVGGIPFSTEKESGEIDVTIPVTE